MAKIIDFGNTYGPFLKIFLFSSNLKAEISLIAQKENPGYIAKAHDWTKHVNYTKEAIDSCSKIDYNKVEIL